MKRSPTRDIIWLFFTTRLLLILITYFGYVLPTAVKHSNTSVDISALLTSWQHWDAAIYLRIAQYGYHTVYDTAFFPLFPLLIAAIAYPLGSWSYLMVGILLSNGALLGTLFVVHRIAIKSGGEQVAQRTLLYLCIFPTAFFFFAPYNESLFLLLTTSTFLALQKQYWRLAGLLGLFAALTRSAGVLLVVPYLYELWVSRNTTTTNRRKMVFGLLPILLIPLGTLLYSVYSWKITENPVAFVTVQYHWGRHLSWPWIGVWQNLFELFWNQPFGSFNEVHVLLDLCATVSFITLTIVGWRSLRTSYTLWAGLLLLYILLSPSIEHDALVSNQRFVLEVFPAFITLAILGIQHPQLHRTLILLFSTLLAILSILFIKNRWMV